MRDLKNPFTAKKVFEEEITRVRSEKAKNLGEWIKKLFYLGMLRNSEKLSYQIGVGGYVRRY